MPLQLSCDVRGFYHELSKYVKIKFAFARLSPVAFFTCHDPHSSMSRCVYIFDVVDDETSRHARRFYNVAIRPYPDWCDSAPGADIGKENEILTFAVVQPAQSPES